MPSISGQNVLVIGGSSGIGFAVAKLSIEQGCRVSIASSSRAKVDSAVARLRASSSAPEAAVVSGYTVDLASEDCETQLEGLFTSATAAGGPLDHVITTSGTPEARALGEIDMPWLTSISRLTLFAPMLLVKLAPKFLRPGYTSSIILTTGQVAEKPIPGYTIRAPLAAAQHGLARSAALDIAPLRINVVAPGATETEMWGAQADVLREVVSKKSLLGRPASPDDVAEAYIYLMRNVDATGSIVSSSAGATLQ
ncbi:hypothetical protein N3K66_006196 [Trichothecium roseum]|uniref:Uncharacterized protein n=1 Tax=Trichothecium roseum TaxID=47278 RepID=A0ACC0V2P3_9HYPO|nr:hypothetical protein N3K66_006196 [Trichothecium roseum]